MLFFIVAAVLVGIVRPGAAEGSGEEGPASRLDEQPMARRVPRDAFLIAVQE